MSAKDLPNPPYYAVIFVNQRTDDDPDGYGKTADQMVKLAQKQPGYLGMESVRDATGKGITVSYWKDMDAIKQWKNDAEHANAREQGRLNWYQDYELQIAKIEHGYRWIRNT